MRITSVKLIEKPAPAGSTVFYLLFKSGEEDYFGSIAAIYEKYTPRDLGVSQQRLYDFKIALDRPYQNKICIIKKGILKRKKGFRKNPGLPG